MNNPIADAFHRHLDECARCHNNPFDLCDRGAILLNAAAIVDQRIVAKRYEHLVKERKNDGTIQEEAC